MKLSKNKVLIKYFLSYFLIFIIPFSILGALMYYQTVTNLKQDIEAASLNSLQQVMETTNVRIKELDDIATRISYDQRLTPYKLRTESHDAILELQKYKANSGIIDEVLLYVHGDDRIYSSAGLNDISTLQQYVYQFSKWGFEEFVEDINHTEYPTFRPAEDVTIHQAFEKRLITYMYPMPPRSAYPYGTVLFLINEAVFTSLIQNILGDNDGSVFIFDHNQELLAEQHRGIHISSPEALSFVSDMEEGIHEVNIDSMSYSGIFLASDQSEWEFLILMPSAQFFGKVTEVQHFILLVLICLVVVGLALAVLISFKQYSPMKAMIKNLQDKWSQPASDKQGNSEWEHIHHTLENIYDQYADMSRQLSEQQPLARDYVLSQLINGSITMEDFNQILESLSIDLRGSGYYVIIMGDSDQHDAKEREQILKAIEEVNLHDETVYSLERGEGTSIVLFVIINKGIDLLTYDPAVCARKIFEKVQKQLAIKSLMGIGKTYLQIAMVNQSFIEASAALEYKFMNRNQLLFFFEEIEMDQGKGTYYPVSDQVKLVQALKQGDKITARNTLVEIMEEIQEKKQSPFHLKCMVFDIVNAILRVTFELKIEFVEQRLQKIPDLHSLESMRSQFLQIIDYICYTVRQQQEQNERIFSEKIVSYIDDHCFSNELSLDFVGDKFQISTSYLSRFFKEKTGVNFSEYVTRRRIDEAKRLLTKKKIPIKDVVTDVGYSDPSHFIKRFKQLEGITPGQYRAKHTT